MINKLVKKYFRSDNWSLTVAKIAAFVWIIGSMVGSYFIVRPAAFWSWIATAGIAFLLIVVGIGGGVYLAVMVNWETQDDT